MTEIFDALILQAKEGNVHAVKILLDRIVLPLKPISAPVNMAEKNVNSQPHAATGAKQILSARIQGRLSANLYTAFFVIH